MSGKQLRGLTRIRRINGILLISMAALELAYGVLALQRLNMMLSNVDDDPEALIELIARAGAIEKNEGTVLIASLAVLLACFLMGAVWVYGAVRNAGLLAPGENRIGPGWAIGWHVVPIANLFMPYRAMVQTYNSSCQPPRALDAPTPNLFGLWWGFWLGTAVLTNLGTYIALSSDRVESYRTAVIIDIVNAPLNVVAVYLWWMVIRTITDMQQAARSAAPNTLSQEVIQ